MEPVIMDSIDYLFWRNPPRPALLLPIIVIVVFLVIRWRTTTPLPMWMMAPAGIVVSVVWIFSVMYLFKPGLLAAVLLFAVYVAWLLYLQYKA